MSPRNLDLGTTLCNTYSMQKKNNIMYLLCIVMHCASVLSHTSDGWRHAFTYRWIKSINRYLLCTYVRTYAYMSFCSHTRVFGVVSCMNLTQYSVSEYNYLVNAYICLIRKKENVKLDSYRWG